MRRGLIFLIIMLFTGVQALASPSTLVADVQSGYVLQAKNADTQQYPASLTKVMTLYIAFDALEKNLVKLDTPLPVSKKASAQPKSKLGLKEGDTITFLETILALIVKSANDASVVLAEALAGTEEKFAEMMTEIAKDLGLNNTTFKNASGLHHPEQKTSAKDMAVLAIAIMRHFPQYYPFFATKSFDYRGKTYNSHNSILLYYEGAEGFKTGFISAVGYNIISTATRNHETLVGVVIGENTAQKRDYLMKKLLDDGFELLKTRQQEWAGRGDSPFYRRAYISKASREKYIPILKKNLTRAERQAKIYLATKKEEPSFALSTEGRKGWLIQVGAFSSKERAKQQLQRACHVLHIPEKNAQTPPYKNLFRAHLIGFDTQTDAQNACQILQNNDLYCFVVAPET